MRDGGFLGENLVEGVLRPDPERVFPLSPIGANPRSGPTGMSGGHLKRMADTPTEQTNPTKHPDRLTEQNHQPPERITDTDRQERPTSGADKPTNPRRLNHSPRWSTAPTGLSSSVLDRLPDRPPDPLKVPHSKITPEGIEPTTSRLLILLKPGIKTATHSFKNRIATAPSM